MSATLKPVPTHPTQPIVLVHGVVRFKVNAIVRYLLDAHPGGLNMLGTLIAADEDRRQLAQLIGYSVSGYGDLPYVDEEECARVDALAEEVVR